MIRTAVFGASGHGGGELIRLIDMHPELEAVYLGAHSKAGSTLREVHPHLAGGSRRLETNDPAELPDVDVAFFALPHGTSAERAMKMRAAGAKVVDLGSDFMCVIAQADSTVRCWGINNRGQLGDGRAVEVLSPSPTLLTCEDE